MRAMIFSHINDQMSCKRSGSIYAGGRATQEQLPNLSTCPKCGGELRVIAAIIDPGLIARILESLRPGLGGRIQPRAPPRARAS